jgi:1-acyl-sn-glycerol-3-phosphate acyltransferase
MNPVDSLNLHRMTLNYRLWRWLLRGIGSVYCNWRIYHPERVPATGPLIFAANHASFGDPSLLGSAIPRCIAFLARDSLFKNRMFGMWLRSLNTLPVDRDGGGVGLRMVLEVLERNGAILLFPEGTRTHNGEIQAARSGLGLAAVKSKAPVVPIRIFGTFEVWGRHRRIPRPGQVDIKFGHPLVFENLYREAEFADRVRLKQIYNEVTSQIMKAISRLEPCADIERFPPQ